MTTNPNPYSSPETASPHAREPRRRGSFFVTALACLGLTGLMIALLLPARRQVREPARRTQCSNNLHQIGVALHNYHDQHGSFPPLYTVDENGKPLHSWRTLLLPYMEQIQLYKTIDLKKPWNDPANKAAFDAELSCYSCPSAGHEPGLTTYLAVVAPDGLFQPGTRRKLAEVTDNRNRTIMLIEVSDDQAVHWMSPMDATEQQILAGAATDIWPHDGNGHILAVDGAVHRLIDRDLTPEQLRALVSINGNDGDVD